ncbi:MAG: hypothetical protein ABEJ83_00235 [Candidatus Nanohaloarchaea archaeon]
MEGLENPDNRFNYIEPLEVYHPLEDFDLAMDASHYASKGEAREIFGSYNDVSAVEPGMRVERVLQIRALRKYLDLTPELVYYPGCGTDLAPSEGFPEADVLYVDIEEENISKLESEGYDAVCAEAESFDVKENTGSKPELIFMYDPSGNPEEIISGNIKQDNWVFADKALSKDLKPVAGVVLTRDGYLEIHDSRPCNIFANKKE